MNNYKDLFYYNKDIIYLDSACSSLKIKKSLKAFEEVCRWGGCGGKRTTHLTSVKVQDYFEKAKIRISRFINSQPDEIIFTSGTTDGMNKLALSKFLNKGNEIVITALEHNSVFFPFFEKSKQENYKLKIIPIKNFKPDIEFFKKTISKNTSIIAINLASNIFGGITNAEELISIARNKNPDVFIILDAAQFITSHKIDVKKLDCDALCFSGHKLGAPYGIGVLYIKKESAKKIEYRYRGGGSVKEVKFHKKKIKIDYLDFPYGFEAGIQNYAGAYALAQAIDILEKISFEKIRNHVRELIIYAKNELSNFRDIVILGSDIENGSILSFISKNKKFSYKDFEIYSSFYRRKIAFRTGRMCADLACYYADIDGAVRLSFSIYNSHKDIDFFIDFLKDYYQKS